ncbi:HTH domain-containing protein [Steroidobacter sp. S1-65]|uniref:HTH domain-containing protein n=1 Tax=Steroidobacter gossypii TaxID=2805490 RepID=A0ABS1X1P9_9GAMM|nr:HTH domain-containing protein [Steroidobacter gossypii]
MAGGALTDAFRGQRRAVPAAVLAEEMNVSLRTIYRRGGALRLSGADRAHAPARATDRA